MSYRIRWCITFSQHGCWQCSHAAHICGWDTRAVSLDTAPQCHRSCSVWTCHTTLCVLVSSSNHYTTPTKNETLECPPKFLWRTPSGGKNSAIMVAWGWSLTHRIARIPRVRSWAIYQQIPGEVYFIRGHDYVIVNDIVSVSRPRASRLGRA